MTLPITTIDALRSLQVTIGKANAEKGFHDEGDKLRDELQLIRGHFEKDDPARADAENDLRNYNTARVALLTTEVAEAIEELRSGHEADKTYYPTWQAEVEAAGGDHNAVPFARGRFKPEGVPSEIADVVIRAFDFADEVGFDLAAIIDEKLAYNATRAKMHGRKF